MTLTMKNVIALDERITKVIITQYWEYPQSCSEWNTILVSNIIPAGEQALITLNFEWIAGSKYLILVECERRDWSSSAQLVAFAPQPIPLENPFGHPFCHRPSFPYDYW